MQRGGALIVAAYDLLGRGLKEWVVQAGIPLLAHVHDLSEALELLPHTTPALILVTVEPPHSAQEIIETLLGTVQGDVCIVLVSVKDASGTVVIRRRVSQVTPDTLQAFMACTRSFSS